MAQTKQIELTICKGCEQVLENTTHGKRCLNCIGLCHENSIPLRVFIDIDNLKCHTCGNIYNPSAWKSPPFYNHGSKTFYCGCRDM